MRVARGKSPTGTILLSAAQESNQVVITLVDDGGGIDAAEVRRKARRARACCRRTRRLSDREAIQLIFTEGFSTARTVTDVSGRGVGLDVVLQVIERLNGLVEAETIPGAGTKFTIQLPLTLAIITRAHGRGGRARSTRCPSGAVVESLRYREARGRPHRTAATPCACATASCPLVHLAELFGARRGASGDGAYAVILGRGDKRLGLVRGPPARASRRW